VEDLRGFVVGVVLSWTKLCLCDFVALASSVHWGLRCLVLISYTILSLKILDFSN
jgi:hypothetical protein